MACNFPKSLVLFLAINLLLFSLVSACGEYCGGGSPKPKPKPAPKPKPVTPYPGTPSSPSTGSCPPGALKLGVCADVLNLLKLRIGVPAKQQCCPLVKGLIDADAAACLCTKIKAGVLGINLDIPVDLSLLVNYCDCKLPKGFQCA